MPPPSLLILSTPRPQIRMRTAAHPDALAAYLRGLVGWRRGPRRNLCHIRAQHLSTEGAISRKLSCCDERTRTFSKSRRLPPSRAYLGAVSHPAIQIYPLPTAPKLRIHPGCVVTKLQGFKVCVSLWPRTASQPSIVDWTLRQGYLALPTIFPSAYIEYLNEHVFRPRSWLTDFALGAKAMYELVSRHLPCSYDAL